LNFEFVPAQLVFDRTHAVCTMHTPQDLGAAELFLHQGPAVYTVRLGVLVKEEGNEKPQQILVRNVIR
jgi:hypothetical protein